MINKPVGNRGFSDPENKLSLKEFVEIVRDWLKFLRSKWLILVVAILLGGTLGCVYSFTKKVQYIAGINFALEEEKSGGGGFGGLASQFGFDLGGGSSGMFSGSNIIQLMTTRAVIERVLLNPIAIDKRRITLAEFYIDFTNKRNVWKDNDIHIPLDVERRSFSLHQNEVLQAIYQEIVNGPLVIEQSDKKVSIISVIMRSENELFSKTFSEVLIDVISDFYSETRSKKARLNVEVLQKQTDSVRNELNNNISGVAYANDNTFNLNPGMISRKIPSTRKQIDVQANTAILTQLVTNLELAKVSLLKETPLIQVIDKPILPLKKERPNFIKLSFLGGISGFFIVAFISFALVFIRNILDKS